MKCFRWVTFFHVLLKIVNKSEWDFSSFLKKRKFWIFFVTCFNTSFVLIEITTEAAEKTDDISCTIAFFCCFETILKDFLHEKWFFEIKCVKSPSKIVKRILLKKLFRFFSAREKSSMNTWELSTFKYVLKVKKLWYFSDSWNKILIALAIKNSFTIQLLK